MLFDITHSSQGDVTNVRNLDNNLYYKLAAVTNRNSYILIASSLSGLLWRT
jgi:hypothetical protein